jgi:phytoene synthase
VLLSPRTGHDAVVTRTWPGRDRDLDAAGITDPSLRAAYKRCRAINAAHGRTYYLSSLLLPADRRPHVHALYAFARVADDMIDSLDRPDPARLVEWSEQALRCLKDPLAPAPDGVVRAVAHTATALCLDHQLFVDFLDSMRSDIHVTRYQTYDDLRAYMWGSAAVIGLMMLPVLGPAERRGTPAGDRARRGVPAHELHPGRRGGSAPRTSVPAA